ncbi:MAG: A/G-specific adenine glycosylase [Planctomycetaceae bacterium]|nr:A/G-specific adenine glycosylase [Planctomycetaceae bacterium]
MSRNFREFDNGWRRRLRSRVLKWYADNGRRLPWRESADAYRIWISEIMLQQTTVAVVVPYFERFLAAFPSVQELAAADTEQVLRLWEGLGYYSRARNLHKAAQVVVEQYDGRFPQTTDELQKLPGVGPYTAAAVASFAFDQPAGILEANTLRLYSRLIAFEADPHGTEGQKTLWKFADWIVSPKHAADFNQAVMDIGADICRPDNPDCGRCPLLASCRACERGVQDKIPVRKQRVPVTEVTEVCVAVCRNDYVLLRRRGPQERWAGMRDFVRIEVNHDIGDRLNVRKQRRRSAAAVSAQPSLFDAETCEPDTYALPEEISAEIARHTGLELSNYHPVTEIRHAVTRYRIRLLCIECRMSPSDADSHSDAPPDSAETGFEYRWFRRDQLADLPLPTTGRQFADLLQGK